MKHQQCQYAGGTSLGQRGAIAGRPARPGARSAARQAPTLPSAHRRRCCSVVTSASNHADSKQPAADPAAAAASSPSPARRAAAALAGCALSAAALLGGPAADPGGPTPSSFFPLTVPAAAARARLTAEEQLNVDVFKRSVPSVVNVTNLAVRRDAFTMNMLEIPQGAGSGFIWDDLGHVVTNYHVIQDASDIQVTALGGEEYSARVIGVDRDKDVAVLQIIGRPGGKSATTDPLDLSGPRPTTRSKSNSSSFSAPTPSPKADSGAAAAAPSLESPEGAAAGAAGAGAGAAGAGGSPGSSVDGGIGIGSAGAAGGGSFTFVPVPSVPQLPALTAEELKVLKPLSLCSSSADLVVGQKVYAIGNPFGLDHTLTTGVISGTGREIQSISGRPIQDVIQTDAAINPGNSGGPLLDSSGCLIGINTAIYSPSGANSGVGFAIPVDVVRSSVSQIIETGRVVRPVLGISFAPDQSTEQLGVKGILVLSAREGGPAWRAGIRGTSRDDYGRLVLGDIITRIDGTRIRNSSDLYRVLDKAQVGQLLDIEVLRGDNEEHLKAKLESSST